jgi:hypothetical protein
MANIDSNLVAKKNRSRGVHAGQLMSVTGVTRIVAGTSVATSDLLRMVPLGENVRPLRIILHWTPVSGTPVLTNAVFSVGVSPILSTSYARPDGTLFAAPTAGATAYVATATVDSTDNMATVIEVKRPVADSVSKFGPAYLTLTPITSAFSVAGGDGDLKVTVEYAGESTGDAPVYTTFVATKVN